MSVSSHSPSNANATTTHSPETTRQIAEARAVLEASILNIGSSLDNSLKSRASNLHANSTALEKQEKDVVKQTEGLRKETDKLKKVADEGARKVKELGNVQNWAEMLERDFLVLEETLRLVEEGSEGDSEWDTESGGESDEVDIVVHRGITSQDRTERTPLDPDGDTNMDAADAPTEKGKVKAVSIHDHQDPSVDLAGSSTATTSASDPSLVSTSASMAS